ncbi:unnamed protein product [Arabidopsis lyrata]|nr:unnamed protein product [Arabidopsis lyrata]
MDPINLIKFKIRIFYGFHISGAFTYPFNGFTLLWIEGSSSSLPPYTSVSLFSF